MESIGDSPDFLRILDSLDHFASSGAPVLITGETGTGKELLAREIHARSHRHGKPFIAVNCGAVPGNLAESEFFGHARGAFTGAVDRKPGKFELADGGTLFLDEVGEMALDLQVKLLRVLQSGEYCPVGVAGTRVTDVRVIAATHCDLEEMIRRGRFRSDLFYRINVVSLPLPALRGRIEDVLPLARHFIRQFAIRYDLPCPSFHAETEKILMGYGFPGNIRELENIMHRAVLECKGDVLMPDALPAALRQAGNIPGDVPENFHKAKRLAVADFERDFIKRQLRENAGIISRAAQAMGLSERNFHTKLRIYGIEWRDYRNLPG